MEGHQEQKEEVLSESKEKKFITSPADIEVHQKIELQDTNVLEEQQIAFKELCNEFLTQEKTHTPKGKEIKILHPIMYMSGLFRGSQINWAYLTKEAYAIYMSITKLTYYLEDADITLRSDHLPLKKFLAKNTLNSKVNNWAIEISPFLITFEYIKGIKNTLVDMMS